MIRIPKVFDSPKCIKHLFHKSAVLSAYQSLLEADGEIAIVHRWSLHTCSICPQRGDLWAHCPEAQVVRCCEGGMQKSPVASWHFYPTTCMESGAKAARRWSWGQLAEKLKGWKAERHNETIKVLQSLKSLNQFLFRDFLVAQESCKTRFASAQFHWRNSPTFGWKSRCSTHGVSLSLSLSLLFLSISFSVSLSLTLVLSQLQEILREMLDVRNPTQTFWEVYLDSRSQWPLRYQKYCSIW